jgi:hypothetical protein
MPDRHLHIVSFDVPFPANYGGVIDVYYKLVALKQAGVKLHLHCFDYGRGAKKELDELCESVNYYPRQTGLKANLSYVPYIVNSRQSNKLMNNLLRDDYPILFEGLHTCFYLDDPRLKNRFKIYRESNIEHHYYQHLFRDEKNLFKKLFFAIESLRLKQYQKVLKHADLMLVVSQSDTDYLKKHFPDRHVEYLPSFHPNDDFSVIPGKGDYVLYHGKLSVTENYKAAEYLIKNIFSEVPHKLVIAGMDPPQYLQELCSKHENVELIINPEDAEMFSLIQNAQANILITFQATGLKLKLLNTLYKGRFCIVNPEMVQGTGLAGLCEVGKNNSEIIQKIEDVMQREFDMDEVEKRKTILFKYYSNAINAGKLTDLIFK